MDSLTHIVLGAAVGTAVLGRKAGPRAAVWGAACATLPDLDVLIAHGDPVRDFTFHRAETHSLFWLTLVAPVIALAIARLSRVTGATFRQWSLLVWLALVTHPLLDAFTVYGTQLLLPFTDYPVGLGSIFIIDPLYTAPLLVGVSVALWNHHRHRPPAHWNAAGLVLSSLYLAWTVAAQSHVATVVQRSVAGTPLAAGRLLVTPTPFNSLLWRVVVMEPRGYHEGLRSIFDGSAGTALTRHPSAPELLAGLEREWSVQRLAWFTKGFYAVAAANEHTPVARSSSSSLRQLFGPVETASAASLSARPQGAPIVMTDLRMGQTPWFVFSFIVGERDGDAAWPVPSHQLPMQRPPVAALPFLWQRIWDSGATLEGRQP
jgi:inner membrane protein